MNIEDWSEPDLTIQFGGTLVLVEFKYRSGLATHTTRDPSRDQVARLLDVAYQEAVAEQFLRREPYVLVVGMWEEEPDLVGRYRDPARLGEALGHHRRFHDYGRIVELLSRRLGYLSWRTLAKLLVSTKLRMGRLERALLLDVADYIEFKARLASLSPEEMGQLALPAWQES